jgi:hypothetical protein
MSRMMPSGAMRPCTRSIQAPGRSINAARFDLVRQPLGLEAPNLAAGRSQAPFTADRPHGGITSEPLSVVHVLVAGKPAEHRLAEQPAQLVACVPATAAVEELRDRDVGEPEGIVEFTVGEQTTVRTDPGAMEFELDPAGSEAVL